MLCSLTPSAAIPASSGWCNDVSVAKATTINKIKKVKLIITLGLASLLITGCTSLQPISTKPPESAIVLKSTAKFSGFLCSFEFPAGEYHPLYEDDGGYYFQAPSKVISKKLLGDFMLDGGLYVVRNSSEPTKWYVIDPQTAQKNMDKISSLPEHTLVP